MSTEESDQDLRTRFARMRAEDNREAPDYRATLARPRETAASGGLSIRRSLVPAMACAAIAIWLLLPNAKAPAPELDGLEAGQWAMPSDVLLDLSSIPGSELMGTFESGAEWIPPAREDANRRGDTRHRRLG